MTTVQMLFDGKEEGILRQIEDLHKALTHFHYEGKFLKDQNVKAIQILAYGLELEIAKHKHLQEQVLFPFLQRHIPRHEAAICMMETEHEEIAQNIEKLKSQVLEMSKLPGTLNEGKVYETGIYVVTLLRHHIGFEKRNIGRSMEKELRQDEKEFIHKQMEEWLEKTYSDKE